MVARRSAWLLAVLVLVGGGCGKKDVTVTDGAPDRSDGPVEPPRDWRTHENARAGFTIAFPRSWRASLDGNITRARSRDGTVVVSIQADRSATGRDSAPGDYALSTLEALPGYRDLEGRLGAAPPSPYETGRADGSGTRARSERRQHVSVTAFQLPGQVTYTAVAFSDPRARAGRRTLDRALATLRAQPPAR